MRNAVPVKLAVALLLALLGSSTSGERVFVCKEPHDISQRSHEGRSAMSK
jgi:hypothetical protein